MGRQAKTVGGFSTGLARRRVPARGPGRLVAIGVVTVFGIVAGSAVGAVLYRTVLQEPAVAAMSMLDVAPAAIAAENETAPAKIISKAEAERYDLEAASAVGGPTVSSGAQDKQEGRQAQPSNDLETTLTERTPDARFVRQAADTRTPSANVSPERFKTAFAQPILAGTLTDSGEVVDAARTGSIIPPAAIVEFAETESEIIEMESKLTALGAEHFKVPQQSSVAPASSAPAVVAPASPEPGLVNAKTRKWVNLRSAPNNKSRVLAVVPAKADIFADEDCTRWCGVVYEGRKGFIYRTFITRAERSSKPVKVASAVAGDDGEFKASSVSAYAVANAEAENMGFKKGCARKWVNLRAGPSSKSEVLTIVPADAEFMVETDCKWCGVVYKGQKGYIYKTFVMYADENNG